METSDIRISSTQFFYRSHRGFLEQMILHVNLLSSMSLSLTCNCGGGTNMFFFLISVQLLNKDPHVNIHITHKVAHITKLFYIDSYYITHKFLRTLRRLENC